MKSRNLISACLLIAIFFTITGSLLSDNNSQVRMQKKFSTFTHDDFMRITPKRIIDKATQVEIFKAMKTYNPDKKTNSSSPKLQSLILPADIRTPSEFEESQAVLITWPEYAIGVNDSVLDPSTAGYGYYHYYLDPPKTYREEKIAYYLMDFFSDSPYAKIWTEMVKAIQPEAQVWIRVAQAKDTSDLKTYLQFKGVSLNNYKFCLDTTGQNGFWTRDFGPFGVYYGADDSLMFIHTMYFPGRPIDNNFPDWFASKFGYNIYDSQLELEGGNFITDGYGKIFFSNVIYDNNADEYGVDGNYKKPMSKTEVNTELQNIFNADELNVLPSLSCDGGTGHIDMYLKMTNDKNFIVMNYPGKYNTPQFPDYATANNNYKTIQSLTSNDGGHYTIDTLPFPLNDKLQLPDAICDSVYSDARTYANGLTVNNTYIVPIYSDPYNSLRQQDKEAIDMLKKYMPGYTIFPIDSRALTTGGGAIHCVTMQIPEENPVVVNHQPVAGLQKTSDALNFVVNASNHSGIDHVNIEFRKVGETAWTSYPMTLNAAQEYIYSIPAGTYQKNDEVEYHITGKTNNGKEFRRPGTNSNYDFYYTVPAGVEDSPEPLVGEIASIVPNPAGESAIFRIVSAQDNKASIMIYNSLGSLSLASENVNLKFGMNDLTFGLGNLSSGEYRVVLNINGKISSKELVIVK